MARSKILRGAFIPGGARPWYSILPDEYEDNPYVLVVMVPRGSRSYVKVSPDNFRVGLLETPRGVRGLQVIGGGGNYMDHLEVIERAYKVPMAEREYVGRLSRMPDKILQDVDKLPLLFLRDDFGKPYLNIKHYFHQLQIPEDDDRTAN